MASVLVLGAGLAGLHAAWRLHEAGVAVTVLEARDRVGGRTWSHTFADGTVVERGGEFIAPDDDVLGGLASELDLELVPHGFSFDRRPFPAHPAPTEAELETFSAMIVARTAALAEDVPASDVLTAPSPVEAMALWRLETSLSAPLSEASARRLLGDPAHRYDPAVRIRGGNQSIARELARRLGERVMLGRAAVAVRHDARRATVICADGRRHEADGVVIALPLPLLLTLTLEPGLPDDLRAAAEHTRFGDAAKLHIPLAQAPAPGAMASSQATWWCWTSQSAGGTRAAPVLSCFAGGAEAASALSAEAALALRPDVTAARGAEPLHTHWARERWTRGSYSVPGVGTTAADDAAWTRPWGAVTLAGEHTAGPRAATMNGAAASGDRAARTMLELLSRRAPA